MRLRGWSDWRRFTVWSAFFLLFGLVLPASAHALDECPFEVFEAFAVPPESELMRAMDDALVRGEAPDGYHLVIGKVKRTGRGSSKLALTYPVWQPPHDECFYRVRHSNSTTTWTETIIVPASRGKLGFRKARRRLPVSRDLPAGRLVALWVRFEDPRRAEPVQVVWDGELFGVRILRPVAEWSDPVEADIALLRKVSDLDEEQVVSEVLVGTLQAQLQTGADPRIDRASLADWHHHHGDQGARDQMMAEMGFIDAAWVRGRLGLEGE